MKKVGDFVPETSIVIKLEDRYSTTLKQMAQVTKAFDKDSEGLERTLHELSGEKSILAAQTDKARKVMKEAQRQFALTGDEADGLRAVLAGREYEDYRRKLEAVNKTLKATEKQIGQVEGISRKSSESMKKGVNEVVGALAASGIGDMVKELASSLSTAFVSSAFGSDVGSIFSSGLSGAASGAAIGTMLLGPGLGTAVGAAFGGGLGVASGWLQTETARDDAFKGYYTGLYDTASGEAEKRITSGSATAAQREKDMISFTTLFKDKQTAEDYLSGLVDMANTTPFLYNDLTAMSKTLATYGFGEDRILPVLQTVGDTGAALGMSVSDMNAVATALGRMESSDKATLEYLNILNDRGIGAINYLAEAKGISVGDAYGAISKGEISGTEAVQIILDALSRERDKGGFAGSMKEQSQTFEGLSSTLEGLKQEIDNAAGEGYNTLRSKGFNAEIADYGGALGEAMKEASRISGENAAYMDNLKEEYRREALGAVLTGENAGMYGKEDREQLASMRKEYLAAQTTYRISEDQDEKRLAALKMEELQLVAEGMATAAYEASDQYKMTQEAEEKSLAALRENTSALNAASAAYSLAQERTKGMAAAWGATTIQEGGTGENASEGIRRSYENRTHANTGRRGRYAYGLDRVPYDNYPALLHAGERVLTARETRLMDRKTERLRETERLTERELFPFRLPAREVRPEPDASAAGQSAVNSVSVTVTGNTFGAGLDEAAVAQALADQIALHLRAGGGR